MGEISDMILDGTLDSITGEYIGEACGYTRSSTIHSRAKRTKTGCPICGKKVTRVGLPRHQRENAWR